MAPSSLTKTISDMPGDIEKDNASVHVVDTDLEHREVSPEDNKRIRRKIDLILLPLLMTVYGLQFLDKTAMTYASVMGFREDNNLDVDKYGWLGGIFYLGYLAGSYPLTLLQQRLPLAKFTSANIIIWGAILCFMSVAKGFASLMVVRFLLGFFESTIAPSLMIFTAQWYKKSEQGTRTGLWTACNALGSVFGGAVAYGLYKADREHSLSIHGWKVIYILLGTVTAFFGIIFCVMVPDTQDKAWFLNSKDKAIARDRLTENHQTVTQQPFRKAQIIEALKDPKVYLYLLISLVNNIPNGGFTNFQAILVQGLGFSTGQTLLMGMASASLGFWIIAVMFFGDKLKHRIAMAYLPLSVSCAGCAMIWGLPKEQKVARVVGFYLALPYACGFTIVVSLIITNVAGRTKKTFVTAMLMAGYCAGNLIGPKTYRAQDAPDYIPALITVVACNIAVMLLYTLLWFLYVLENKRRDALAARGEVPEEDDMGLDLTDVENKQFRYTV